VQLIDYSLPKLVDWILFLICSYWRPEKRSLWPVLPLARCYWMSVWQGRNQERANRAIAPPEIFANVMAFTYFTRKVISRNCVRSTCTSSQDNLYANVFAASYGIHKLLTNQCTTLPKTANPELESTFQTLVVIMKWTHPFHESEVVNVTSQSRNPHATNRGYNYTELLLNLAGFSHC